MAVGLDKGVKVTSGVCAVVIGRDASVGVDCFDDEQAESPVRSASRNEISFVA